MTDNKDDNIVVATQFSRLRSGRDETGPQPEVDLAYEAASALSESMELLSAALQGVVSGEKWDSSRHDRLKERINELSAHLGDGHDQAAQAATRGDSEASEGSDASEGAEVAEDSQAPEDSEAASPVRDFDRRSWSYRQGD